MQAHLTPWRFFLGLAIVVFLAGQYLSPRVSPEDLDNLLLDTDVIPGDPISLFQSIELALTGTRFEKQWNVNSPYEKSSLSIFLIDSSDPRLATHRYIRRFRQNAAYLRRLCAIVIDYQFIETLGNKYFTSDLDMGVRSLLLNWIMGHEIGHLIRKHRTSHFESNNMFSRKRRGGASQYREDEADEYFADIIRANGQDLVTTYGSVFAQIVEYEADLRTGQDTTRDQLYSHPTYLVRAFRFLERIVGRGNNDELADLIEGWGRELGL